ncbi:hypothetical protein J5N97_000526 [Dioscorea zingiberensis]|uniref:LisH domain-containing protein n=1 Tax=Dioscorea zingiberensis TaxID=325984 RepID=A0A9D5BSF7_9LILI|nr:hypothetical protein J5N97_000526 [Dioscorea zingiberensis]
MDVEKSSLCNCVVNFLLEENYLLTAFELLHELLDDGRDDQAIRLKTSSPTPPNSLPIRSLASNSLRVADPQSLLQEKEAVEEKLAISEYELRLAQEDILKFKTELQKKAESPVTELRGNELHWKPITFLKPLHQSTINCHYFSAQVTDQNLDVWQNSPAYVYQMPCAIIIIQYLSSTTEAAEGLQTIQILADALPKIVPYVLINHMRLTGATSSDHASSALLQNVGEMRTETELLPQCWEQINHMYEERRLLVAQSCGELAEFVRPEIRDSLILSIVQQLIEDSATVVREAAVRNLALLLPRFPNMDKYFKFLLAVSEHSEDSYLTHIYCSYIFLVAIGEDAHFDIFPSESSFKIEDISATSVRDFLLPTIQNLLKDSDALDPVHKEALEIIMKERSGGTFETISKVMGAGLASSVSSFFGEGGLLGKKDSVEPLPEPAESRRLHHWHQ